MTMRVNGEYVILELELNIEMMLSDVKWWAPDFS